MSLIKSETIGKLIGALAAAKAAFAPVLKLSENPGFKRNGKASKYADLATAIAATEDSLLANGLVVSQFPVNDGDRVGALTILTHSSGEYMGESFTLPLGKQDAQTGVAAVTYARRTGYLAALGIASEDDDGQTAAGREDIYEGYSHPSSTTEMPDFQDAHHAAPKAQAMPDRQHRQLPQTSPFREVAEASARPTSASTPKVETSGATSAAGNPATASAAPEIKHYSDFKGITEVLQNKAPEHGDAWEGPEVSKLPTEAEMAAYRERFTQLANELSTHGKLTASKGLKLNTKLLVFFLQITKADAAKNVSNRQWEDFFQRTDAAIKNPEVGLLGLTKLINKANGIEPKQ
jgi:hypothetical protein